MTETLLGPDAEPREVIIPEGWRVVKRGRTIHGDQYWNWPNQEWKEVRDSNSFACASVVSLQCVIRKVGNWHA